MKLLVANRGEIACRIFETCRMMGISTVALAHAADSKARHALMADEVIELPGETLAETYLNADFIVSEAKKRKVDLIHPGYGFLSERASFATLVQKAGIQWIGPDPQAIERMGSKIESKKLADSLQVSTLPWKFFEKAEEVDSKEWIKSGKTIGYPLLVKASGGGGGRGMRLVHKEADLMTAVESAMREAKGAFGDAAVFLEKYIESSRHIEVQIVADSKGNIVHLFDRECSAQRRHQKVIEEAPAPFLSQKTKQALWEAAIKLARSIQYKNAGTLEFLVDEKENWFFLEMNTRLQVEHPVTEMITGVDLVKLQIEVAQGNPLPFSQDDIVLNGHAIECRLYAEDPAMGFLPTPGPVTKLTWPTTRNTRIDTGITEGGVLSDKFDPMVAKLATWGKDRETARLQMQEALAGTTLLGFGHNISFLQFLLSTEAFKKGQMTTGLIEKKLLAEWNLVPEKEMLENLVSLLLTSRAEAKGKNGGSAANPNLFSVIDY